MDDPTLPTDGQHAPICPWCSAALPGDPAVCPSCGAILLSDEAGDVPGLTAVDDAIVRGEKRPSPRRRLFSWISGEYQDDVPNDLGVVADATALAPPAPDVEREMLRLELEAEVSKLQAGQIRSWRTRWSRAASSTCRRSFGRGRRMKPPTRRTKPSTYRSARNRSDAPTRRPSRVRPILRRCPTDCRRPVPPICANSPSTSRDAPCAPG